MPNLETTKMSSKGQVVIPEEIRKKLGIKVGEKFIVVGEGDVVILKILKPPSLNEFDMLIKQARSQAKKAKLKKSDIKDAVKQARK